MVYGALVDHQRRVVLGLGSNLGDRAASIAQAIELLRADSDFHVMRASALYESPPAGGPPQADYLNGAVLVVTSLEASAILDRALAIERSLGRVRPDAVRWGPRTLDIDILWIEGESVAAPELTVPHPRLADRPFAVQPLLELAPDAGDPATGARFAALPAATAALRRVD